MITLDETFAPDMWIDLVPTHLEMDGFVSRVRGYPTLILEIAPDRKSAYVRIWHIMTSRVWVSAWAIRHREVADDS